MKAIIFYKVNPYQITNKIIFRASVFSYFFNIWKADYLLI